MKENSRRVPALDRAAPATLGMLVAALFAWWAWRAGAYSGVVFYPGAIGFLLLVGALLAFAPFPARLSGAPLAATVLLAGLAGWTALSLIWTNAGETAPLDVGHGLAYLAIFGLGGWLTLLLSRDADLASAPVAVAATAVGVAVVVILATGTDLRAYFHSDATLRLPLGYRNADAAFFLIAVWPLLSLASGRRPVVVRALALGATTMLLELALLCQSRGSIAAAAVGLVVFIAVSPRRLRTSAFVLLATLPLVPALPTLLAVYQHNHLDPGLVPLLRDAARAIIASVVGTVVVGVAIMTFLEPRVRPEDRTADRLARLLAVLAILVLAGGTTVFFAQRGGPFQFLDQRLNEFEANRSADLNGQGTRFGTNVESHRADFWRVAWGEGIANPILGGGVGSFQFEYLRQRRSDEAPADPHNVELLMFAELGLPGLILFVAFLVAAVVAAIAARRLGGARLASAALAAAAYWLVHASYDKLWNFPAATAPAIFLLGAAAAPSFLERGSRALRTRVYLGAVVTAVAVLGVPLYLSDRIERGAIDRESVEPSSALADFSRAADLDPFAVAPLIRRGTAAAAIGEEMVALASFVGAESREPDYFLPYLLAGALARRSRPDFALAQLERAHELNPRDTRAASLLADSRHRPKPVRK